MNTSSRLLVAAALLATLAACGNKGPLVHPTPPADANTPAASPPSTDPTGTQPATPQPTPADADPGGAVPPATTPVPPPAAGSSGGNG